ncbi:MAG: HAD family hydrolase [Desulfuromusa sp.]|nr:HAD family hydrolase [Desulfuromusa sp.]
MKRIGAVIFDCDGVMFASHRANLAYYNRILAEFSYPLVFSEQKELAQMCHTASSPEVLANLFHPNDLAMAKEFAATVDYREFIPYMEPELNFLDLLQRLSGDYPLAIATNRGKSILAILDHFNLQDYFSVVVTSHDVERPKPAPDMLFLAAEKLDIEPERCVFIGDSELDKIAAAEANVQFASYGGGVSGMISLSNHLELLDYL